jgi:heptosyltransferase-2
MNATVTRLVVFAPNWLGDAVMSIPAIEDIRRGAPDASLTIAARSAIAPVFSLVPGIDHFVGPRDLRSQKFDAAVLLPNSFHAALVARRADIPERWGYRTDWRGWLLTRAVAAPAGVHQVEYYQTLARELGFGGASRTPRIVLAPDARMRGDRALADAGWDGRTPLVAFAAGSAYGGAKRWPARYFAELADLLAGDGVQVVMVGSHADRSVGLEIERGLERRNAAISVFGTDLPTLAAVLARCRVVVSNDSGAMHLAAALGVRVTAVFGPTDERQTRPSGDGHAVLTHPVWCRPCMLSDCPIDHQCMRGLGVDRVARATRDML